MAKFVGGPYDGMDLPFDPHVLRRVNLPDKEHLAEYLNVPDTTTKFSWPHVYEADTTVNPPHYRFIEQKSSSQTSGL